LFNKLNNIALIVLEKEKKYKDEFKCKTCLGSAVTLEDKTLKVNIKKGMNHGTQIQFESEGDESPIASAGDIIIILQQKKHDIFLRQQEDLVIIKKISFSEAICGFEFKLVHLDKRILIIRNKKGDIIKPDSIKQLKNEGMPSLEKPKKKKENGHLYIQFEVEFPKKNTYGNCRKIIKHITQKNNS